MRVLALDTTTRGGSAALIGDDGLVDERPGDPLRPHAERLPRELLELVAAHHVALSDIDVFAVAVGPGSFTGLRIGIATIQGLALTSGRPIAAVSALDALAQIGSRTLRPGQLVAAWMDAHRREVFAALYRVSAEPIYEVDRLEVVRAPSVGAPAEIARDWASSLSVPPVFIGDAVQVHADETRRLFSSPNADIVLQAAPLLAGAIGRMALARARRGDTIHPAAVQPLYVRRPDAEVARDASR